MPERLYICPCDGMWHTYLSQTQGCGSSNLPTGSAAAACWNLIFVRVMGAQRAPRLSAFGKPLFRQRLRLTAGLTLIFVRVMELAYILG